jgi:hypothetical protein
VGIILLNVLFGWAGFGWYFACLHALATPWNMARREALKFMTISGWSEFQQAEAYDAIIEMEERTREALNK